MTRPFANVRVLDFTQVIAGQYGSCPLALLGADVVKVERREFDEQKAIARTLRVEKAA